MMSVDSDSDVLYNAAMTWITPKQVADILPDLGGRKAVSLRTVRRWIASGKLPTRKVGGKLIIQVEDVAAMFGQPASDPLPRAITHLGAMKILRDKYGF